MEDQRHKICVVPRCNNTTKASAKVFFEVPTTTQNDLREQWKAAIGGFQRPISMESDYMYCCEDHFDVQEDTANFIEYQTSRDARSQGLIQLQLKRGVVPHRFECQKRTKKSVETVPKDSNKISYSCYSDIKQPQCDNSETALAREPEANDTNILNKDKSDREFEEMKSNAPTSNRRLILICKPVKIILNDLKYAIDPKISSLENTIKSVTRAKQMDPIINTMALSGNTNGKRKQENFIDTGSKKRRKLIPKVLLWEREQTQCILIHDLQTRELDIYFLNSDLNITTYQRFSNVDSKTNPYVTGFKGRKNGLRVGQCCCWFCRENFIKILGKCMRTSIEFTRKPHVCEIYDCSCCCRNMPLLSPDVPIKLVSSIDTPYVWFKKLKAYYASLQQLTPYCAIGRALIDVPKLKVEDPNEEDMYKSMKIRIDNEYYEIGVDGYIALYQNGDHTEQPVRRPDISKSICCWYKREQFANSLLKHKVRTSTLKFMRTPHLCPGQCMCCCRPRQIRTRIIPRMSKSARMITNHTTDVGNKNMKIKIKFPKIVHPDSRASPSPDLPECNLGMSKTSMFSMPVVTENTTSCSSTKRQDTGTMPGAVRNTLTTEKSTLSNVSNKSIATSSIALTNNRNLLKVIPTVINMSTTEINVMPAIVNRLPRTHAIASTTTVHITGARMVPIAAQTTPDISTIHKTCIPATVSNNLMTIYTASNQVKGNLSSDIRNIPSVGFAATPVTANILNNKPIASTPSVMPTIHAPKYIIVPAALTNAPNKSAILSTKSNPCAAQPATVSSVTDFESPKKTSHTIKTVPATTVSKLFIKKSTGQEVKLSTPLSVSTSQEIGAFSRPFIHKARIVSRVDDINNAAVATLIEPITSLPSVVANVSPAVTNCYTVTTLSGTDNIITPKLQHSSTKSPTLRTLKYLKNLSFINNSGGKLSAQLGTSLCNLSTPELKILNSIFILVENQLKAAGLEQANLKLDLSDILDNVILDDIPKTNKEKVDNNSNDLAQTNSTEKHTPLPTLPSYKGKRYDKSFIAVSGNQKDINNTILLNERTNVPENGTHNKEDNLENPEAWKEIVGKYVGQDYKGKGKSKTSPSVINSKGTQTHGSANVSIKTLGGAILIDGSASTSDSDA